MPGIDDIPTWLASAWNINETTAELILSAMIIFTVLLPVMYLTKGRNSLMLAMTFFIVEGILVGLGWLPFWRDAHGELHPAWSETPVDI